MQKQYRRTWSKFLEDESELTILNRDFIGRSIHKLQPGDHIGWERSYLIWHHGIVIEVKSGSILVFHFSKDKTDGRIKILKEEKGHSENHHLYRFNYPSNVLKHNPPCLVLRRAKDMSENQKSYNLFSNNCEHFAMYCKTGELGSCQTEWLSGKAKGAAGFSGGFGIKGATTIGVRKAVNSSASQALRETGKASAKRVIFGASKSAESSIAGAPSKVISQIGSYGVGSKIASGCTSPSKAAMIKQATLDTGRIFGGATKAGKIVTRVGTFAGAAITGVVDIISTGRDIYKYKTLKDAGKMSKADYKKNVTERVCEGTIGSIATAVGDLGGMKVGALAGAGIGSFFGPIGAVVGAGIGSIAGAVIGSIAARGVGKAIGRCIGRFFGRFFK